MADEWWRHIELLKDSRGVPIPQRLDPTGRRYVPLFVSDDEGGGFEGPLDISDRLTRELGRITGEVSVNNHELPRPKPIGFGGGFLGHHPQVKGTRTARV